MSFQSSSLCSQSGDVARSPEIHFSKHGNEYRLETEISIARPRSEVFRFFSDAGNLQRITPDFLKFSILTPLPIEMRKGALIEYRIALYGIPIRWRTLISAWEPESYFVDTQIRGPYLLWEHHHEFESVGPRQTLIKDRVHYRPRGGTLLDRLFVRPNLEKIFSFRHRALLEILS